MYAVMTPWNCTDRAWEKEIVGEFNVDFMRFHSSSNHLYIYILFMSLNSACRVFLFFSFFFFFLFVFALGRLQFNSSTLCLSTVVSHNSF